MHRTLAFLAAVVLTTISVATAGFATVPGTVQFRLEPARSADRVQLSMRHGRNSNWSSATAVSELRGLDIARVRSGSSAPIGFALVREAGRFDCSGQGGNSSARGDCRFTADAGFANFLASRGIGRPTRDQAFALAMSGVGRAHVEALSANHYPAPTVDDLVAMGIHSVDASFIRAMAAAGPQFRDLGATDLVAFRIHGVSPDLVRTYARLGYGRLDRQDAVAMAIHGVTPRFIEELAQLGYRGVPADDLVQMRIFGVTPEFIRSVERRGMGRPPVAELVQMRIMGRRRSTR
jgi:hypothetical protein